MGCGGSKEASHELRQVPARMVVSAPSGGPQLVPPAYRNAAAISCNRTIRSNSSIKKVSAHEAS